MSAADGKARLIEGSWVAHRLAMKESPAWRALPDNGRRVLDLLETEHMRHAGTANGQLAYTYDQFQKSGIRRASVALAIRQCVALGFLEVTRVGYKSAAEFKVPSLYRLTYVFGRAKGAMGKAGRQDPTEEWQQILDDDGAAKALAAARSSARVVRRVAAAQLETDAPPSPMGAVAA